MGIYLYLTLVLFDNVVADIQTQPGAFTDRLGGEKRVENLGLHVFGDARPVVFYLSTTLSFSWRVRIVISPLPSMASAALSIMLVHTWLSSLP